MNTPSSFINPDSATIKALLERVETIAVAGLSPRPTRPSHQVAAHLQRLGYRIIPVRPAVDQVLGERAYPVLADVPMPLDLVVVFRAPEHVMPVAQACVELGVPALWLQEGVVNLPAAVFASEAGLIVVMDRCISKEYVRTLL